MKKDLISIKDLTSSEINELFELASKLKLNRKTHEALLKNKTLGLVFEKPSNRTRVSFEVGMSELGGSSIYLGSGEIELGKREAVKDAAKVLSRYLDVIVLRTFSHNRLIEFAEHSTAPVINGLTDLLHPCQGLSDVFTIKEKKGLKGITVAFIGDGNNVANSLLYACNKMGIKVKMACPSGYEPDKAVIKEVGDTVSFFNSVEDAVKDADVIYTDVWTSMGKEKEREKRLKAFNGFQLNAKLLKLAKKDTVIMHCLPAHRGEEITDEVLDSKQAIVIDQAENRLHVQKAILVKLLK
ncbi:MAG: ornithine carbamoyltransferase [Candidatus Omnitrophica bacterium]|nr:ornithine carbamoyltransferase [Candidatus Omnitrophota bacterium]MBU4457722.1 ornithine carbamoyltransferase [Candidatus Omnitrophota bacterium]